MEPEYLRSCSKDMLDSIKEVDKDGVWLIESWAFSYSNWKDEDILCQFTFHSFSSLQRFRPSLVLKLVLMI